MLRLLRRFAPRNDTIRSIILNDWIIALFLLGVFCFTTVYKYGWDDQHLEIPLLKHLIDPTLFAGDYYVESLKKNFSSYFYPLLARIITVEQIPAAYFLLYFISRYFLFFWSYKLWKFISGDRLQGFLCTLSFFILVRVDEFLYRTFSHQEFTLAIIVAGIYFFFRNRLVLASIILGIAANFHALYSLFPMIFIMIYMLWNIKIVGWKKLFTAGFAFAACCIPFLIWILQNRFSSVYTGHPLLSEWTALFQLACPQNFMLPLAPFHYFLENIRPFFYYTKTYWFLILLFILNLSFNKPFRKNPQAVAYCVGAFGLLVISLLFTYVHPIRSVVDLNLIRNSQYLLFLLIGFTTLLTIRVALTEAPFYGFMMAVLLSCYKYGQISSIDATIVMLLLLGILVARHDQLGWRRRAIRIFLAVAAVPFIYFIFKQFQTIQFSFNLKVNLLVLFALLSINYIALSLTKNHRWQIVLRYCFVIIPLVIFTLQFGQYRAKQMKLETEGGNYFWAMQQSWEDMQAHVKMLTPKEAMVLIPYNTEMCGFRIGSERKVVVSYRDCGIIGFDYQAALEWKKRINDVEAFTITPTKPFVTALQNATNKYGADYIVFMRFASPKKDVPGLKQLYTNQHFTLFQITR